MKRKKKKKNNSKIMYFFQFLDILPSWCTKSNAPEFFFSDDWAMNNT